MDHLKFVHQRMSSAPPPQPPLSSPAYEVGILCSVTIACDWFIWYIVPGAPLNLDVMIVNSSAVEVSWSPPLLANGIILEYQVYYVDYDKLKMEEKAQKVS